MKKLILLVVIFLLVAIVGILTKTINTPVPPPVSTEHVASTTQLYSNTRHGYTAQYPHTLQIKEYSPEDVVFGHITVDADGNEFVDGVAEARIMMVTGVAGKTFRERVAEELGNLCAADGPNSTFSCTGIEHMDEFVSEAGMSVLKLYLKGELKELPTGKITTVSKGPYFIFLLDTSATASKVLVVHAPLNQSTDEADVPTITAIAQSVLVDVNEEGIDGDPQDARVMDINTFVSLNISTLSPVQATLGGTFYVTKVEAKDGAGTVQYEDGHSAYTAHFTYAIDVDKGITITSFDLKK